MSTWFYSGGMNASPTQGDSSELRLKDNISLEDLLDDDAPKLFTRMIRGARVTPTTNNCTPAEYREFVRSTPQFEQMLVESGIHLIKFWFSVGEAEQRRRFLERRTDPVKRWKLSPTDIASLDKWNDYTQAKEAMFQFTDTKVAPWTVVKSNDKKRARIEVLRWVLTQFDYPGKNASVLGAPDPLIIGSPDSVYDQGETPTGIIARRDT